MKAAEIDEDMLSLLKAANWEAGAPILPKGCDAKVKRRLDTFLRKFGGVRDRTLGGIVLPYPEIEYSLRGLCETNTYVDYSKQYLRIATSQSATAEIAKVIMARIPVAEFGSFLLAESHAPCLSQALFAVAEAAIPQNAPISFCTEDSENYARMQDFYYSKAFTPSRQLAGTLGSQPPDRLYDCVVSQSALGLGRDAAAMQDAVRFVSPGGTLFALLAHPTTVCTHPISQRFMAWFADKESRKQAELIPVEIPNLPKMQLLVYYRPVAVADTRPPVYGKRR